MFLGIKYIEMKSYIIVLHEFIKPFVCNYWKKPLRIIIKCLTDKFYVSGSVHAELKDKVWQILKKDHGASTVCLAQQLGIL